jgi:ubiquinone/menaquinone biosynthesis C-methylase UbiE
MTKVNYDTLAKHYDFLSRLVFQKSQVNAQVCLLHYVSANNSILIVGGGTGWILEELTKRFSSGLVIDYVEISAKMIVIAKQRNHAGNKVTFINMPIEDFNGKNTYDIILTPFLFDNFLFNKAELVFNKLDGLLKTTGKWLQVDFIYDKTKSKFWQKALLKTMYFFFKIVCHIEASELINMDVFFNKKYHVVFETWHYFKFIKSSVYEKNKNIYLSKLI